MPWTPWVNAKVSALILSSAPCVPDGSPGAGGWTQAFDKLAAQLGSDT